MPAQPFFWQAVCLQRRIKPREVVSTAQSQQIKLTYVQWLVERLTYGVLWQLHLLVGRRADTLQVKATFR